MKVIGQKGVPDWPRLGPALLIGAAMVVAIRTARWPSRKEAAGFADVDADLDREVGFAVRVMGRVLHGLLARHPGRDGSKSGSSAPRVRGTP